MKNTLCAVFICQFAALFSQVPEVNKGSLLKINQVQVIATHNSYHIKTDAAVFRFLKGIYSFGILPSGFNPAEIDYTKPSLTEQLENGHVRGLELDVWNDPEGGRFYDRMGKRFVFKRAASKVEELKKPGFKILHIPDFDFNTTNYTLVSALTEIKKWSDAHPNHFPVFINIEAEVETPGDMVPMLRSLTKAARFDSVAADELDKEVRSVFGDPLQGVVTPDMVRGNYATLEQAVLAGNWPTINEARGKVIFIIDGDSRTGYAYAKGHPSYKGRTMFAYADPGKPEAAFVILNDPEPQFAEIQKRVKQGYIVRTRSDGGTHEAREGNYKPMKAALASWAQIVSTDYYVPDKRAGQKGWTDYHVQLPGNAPARVDSISAGSYTGNEILHE